MIIKHEIVILSCWPKSRMEFIWQHYHQQYEWSFKIRIGRHDKVYHELLIDGKKLIIPNHFHEYRNKKPELLNTENLNFSLIKEDDERLMMKSDIFSFLFYVLSGLSLINTKNFDQYGRYELNQQSGLHSKLKVPLADEFFRNFLYSIAEIIPIQYELKSSFRFVPTVDIDAFYAFKHKSFLHKLLGLSKDIIHLNTGRVTARLKSLSNKDPYDSFEYLTRILGNEILYFVLMDYNGPADPRVFMKLKELKKSVLELSEKNELGLHGSFSSFGDQKMINLEREELQSIIAQPIDDFRMHFLRFRYENTFKILEASNISDDYSTGFTNVIGYPYFTVYPVKYYDHENDQKGSLSLHSTHVMDRSLKNIYGDDKNKALKDVKPIIDSCRNAKGEFVLLWHNSSFAAFEGWDFTWKELFEEIVTYAKANS